MIYVLIGLNLFFVAIGLLVTENNAKYLLAGYNTISSAEREQYDINSYIPYFRKFHLILGATLLEIGLILNYFLGEQAGAVFLGLYPILAYSYFIGKSSKFSKKQKTEGNRIGFYILVGALLAIGPLIFTGVIFSKGFQENKLLVNSNSIRIEGSYGEEIALKDITSISYVSELPPITRKTNGFAAGDIYKGYFRTSTGEIIKLILHSADKPYILIIKSSGARIYYASKEKSNRAIMAEMKKALSRVR